MFKLQDIIGYNRAPIGAFRNKKNMSLNNSVSAPSLGLKKIENRDLKSVIQAVDRSIDSINMPHLNTTEADTPHADRKKMSILPSINISTISTPLDTTIEQHLERQLKNAPRSPISNHISHHVPQTTRVRRVKPLNNTKKNSGRDIYFQDSDDKAFNDMIGHYEDYRDRKMKIQSMYDRERTLCTLSRKRDNYSNENMYLLTHDIIKPKNKSKDKSPEKKLSAAQSLPNIGTLKKPPKEDFTTYFHEDPPRLYDAISLE